jgi:hypothetical protein
MSRAAGFTLLSTIAVIVITTGCGGTAATVNADNRWMASLIQSGGIAGTMKTISVDSTGMLDVRGKNSEILSHRTLAEEEAEQLSAMIAAAFSSNKKIPVSELNRSCRDCMQFHLTLRSVDRELLYSTDSSGLADSYYQPLISKLIQLGKQSSPSGKQ